MIVVRGEFCYGSEPLQIETSSSNFRSLGCFLKLIWMLYIVRRRKQLLIITPFMETSLFPRLIRQF